MTVTYVFHALKLYLNKISLNEYFVCYANYVSYLCDEGTRTVSNFFGEGHFHRKPIALNQARMLSSGSHYSSVSTQAMQTKCFA